MGRVQYCTKVRVASHGTIRAKSLFLSTLYSISGFQVREQYTVGTYNRGRKRKKKRGRDEETHFIAG